MTYIIIRKQYSEPYPDDKCIYHEDIICTGITNEDMAICLVKAAQDKYGDYDVEFTIQEVY